MPEPLKTERRTTSFAVTWDYRCPFARNAHEHVVAALRAGAPWDVTFAPFSLNQVHVQPGEADVWDDPNQAAGLLAMEAALAVRDQQPDRFLDVHEALFRARHDDGRDLRQPEVVSAVLTEAGADADAALAVATDGTGAEKFRKEHESVVHSHDVFGVPTFIVGDRAVFVRLMHRPKGDADGARATIERVLDLLTWTELNEFKLTSVDR